LELVVSANPPVQVLGAPVEIECAIRNTSAETQRLVPHARTSVKFEASVVDHPELVVFSKPAEAALFEEIQPGQEVSVVFGPAYGSFFCSPGTYELVVRPAEGFQQELLAFGCEELASTTRIVVSEPVGVDADAFEEAFQGASPSSVVCREATVVSQFLLHKSLVDEYPTALYAGYAYNDWKRILPGVGTSLAKRVAQLSAADFFDRYPTVSIGDKRKPLRDEAQRREELNSSFLERNPGFIHRAELEGRLGELRIALGKNAAAR